MKEVRKHIESIKLETFFDGELEKERAQLLQEHIKGCPECRKILSKNNLIASSFKELMVQETSIIELKKIEYAVLNRVAQKNIGGWLGSSLFSVTRRAWIPATVGVAAALFFLVFFSPTPSPLQPSAFVHSLKADVSSVMILETSRSRQTVLWFEEVPYVNGGDDQSGEYEGRWTAPQTKGLVV